jgi:hypothetical protein
MKREPDKVNELEWQIHERKKDLEIMRMYICSVAVGLLIWIFLIFIIHTVAHASEVDTTKAVIHHTDSGCWTTVEDIDRWHKERTYIDENGQVKNWDGIGYHYVITCDGKIHRGRDIRKQGAHALGRNNWIGIALVGKGTFTDGQHTALKEFIRNRKISHVEVHHEECPGPRIDIGRLK